MIEKVVCVAVLVLIEDRFVLVYNDKRRCWELPGGRVENNETPEEAVRRECLEEAGVELSQLRMAFEDKGVIFYLGKGKIVGRGDMNVGLFKEIPEELCYPREEIEKLLSFLSILH